MHDNEIDSLCACSFPPLMSLHVSVATRFTKMYTECPVVYVNNGNWGGNIYSETCIDAVDRETQGSMKETAEKIFGNLKNGRKGKWVSVFSNFFDDGPFQL